MKELEIKNITLDNLINAIIKFNKDNNLSAMWKCNNIDDLSFQYECDFIVVFENKNDAVAFKMEYI